MDAPQTHRLAAPRGQRDADALMPALQRQEHGFDALLLIVSELGLVAQGRDGGERRGAGPEAQGSEPGARPGRRTGDASFNSA